MTFGTTLKSSNTLISKTNQNIVTHIKGHSTFKNKAISKLTQGVDHPVQLAQAYTHLNNFRCL